MKMPKAGRTTTTTTTTTTTATATTTTADAGKGGTRSLVMLGCMGGAAIRRGSKSPKGSHLRFTPL